MTFSLQLAQRHPRHRPYFCQIQSAGCIGPPHLRQTLGPGTETRPGLADAGAGLVVSAGRRGRRRRDRPFSPLGPPGLAPCGFGLSDFPPPGRSMISPVATDRSSPDFSSPDRPAANLESRRAISSKSGLDRPAEIRKRNGPHDRGTPREHHGGDRRYGQPSGLLGLDDHLFAEAAVTKCADEPPSVQPALLCEADQDGGIADILVPAEKCLEERHVEGQEPIRRDLPNPDGRLQRRKAASRIRIVEVRNPE